MNTPSSRIVTAFAILASLAAWLAVRVSTVTAASPALPEMGVTMKTDDADLQRLYDAAEQAARNNLMPFTGDRKTLVEGGGYFFVWLETQPMGGAMYAKRNLEVALNNQLVFLEGQRADGRIPSVIIPSRETRQSGWDQENAALPPGLVYSPNDGVTLCFHSLGAHSLPSSALDVYYLAGCDRKYLERLYRALEAYDAYLWRTRDSNGDGVLELWCGYDNGEDNSVRILGVPHGWPHEEPPVAGRSDRPVPETNRMPYQSMDAMSWSFEGRRVLAELSAELGNGQETHWRRKAEEVQRKLIDSLWRPDKHACYDRDKDGQFMDVLLHNNLRCMWFGSFTQEMADAFVRHHLLNPDEFWTPMPLPSIAVNDPLFQNATHNNWSGQPQGLTFQRAIRALENYGHYAEVTLIGDVFLRTVGRTCRFRQQFDPFTGAPDDVAQVKADYGPTVLATLEYISRMHGIHIDRRRILWSGLPRGEHSIIYTQRWGERTYTLQIADGQMTGSLNGRELFHCTAGVRIVTDIDGNPLEVVGIAPEPQSVTLRIGENTYSCEVPPNTTWTIRENAPPTLGRRVPFDYQK